MKTALIESGVVVQIQPPNKVPVLDDDEVIGYTEHPADGFVEVDDSVCCGMLDNGDGTFTNPPPAPKTQEETNAEHRSYLNSTDWYLARLLETDEEVPQEVLDARQLARDSIV